MSNVASENHGTTERYQSIVTNERLGSTAPVPENKVGLGREDRVTFANAEHIKGMDILPAFPGTPLPTFYEP